MCLQCYEMQSVTPCELTSRKYLSSLKQNKSLTMEDTAASIFGVIGILFALALTVVVIAAQWRIFEKAGKPGWAAIIPIYSTIVLLEIVGKPVWWIILFLIPFVNLVVAIMVFHQLSLSFGKDVGFTLGLIFLNE